MRSVDTCNGATVSGVVNLDCVVPATRYDLVLIRWVEFNTEDAVRMPRLISKTFHGESQRLCSLIVDSDLEVTSSNRE